MKNYYCSELSSFRKKFFHVFALVLIANGVFGSKLPAPIHLRCDLLRSTLAVSKNGLPASVNLDKALTESGTYQYATIVSSKPVFTWEVDTVLSQTTAYRILVSSSQKLLSQGKGDFWNSGKVSSKQSRGVYQGKALQPGKIYYWKVQVWNKNGQKTSYSETASFFYDSISQPEPFSYPPLSAEIQYPTQIQKTASDFWFLDFGKAALAQLQLRLTSEANDTVQLEIGEAVDKKFSIDKNPGRNIRYLKVVLPLKKGTHNYSITWPVNSKRDSRDPIKMPDYIGEVYPFRYVTVHNYRGTIEKEAIQRKMVFHPFDEEASSFQSSDTVLNQVWDLCKYSIKATSFMGYYVDGDRERLPYEADALINQLSHYAVDAEYSIGRRTAAYLLFHPTWPTEWSLQNILIAWNDYAYTGDDLLLKTYYPELQKKMLMPLAGNNGLISTRTDKQTDEFLNTIHITKNFDNRRGLHDNVDWPQTRTYIGNEKEYGGETDGFVFNPYNSVVNAYYYHCLVLMQKIALTLGKKEDALLYKEMAERVYRSFQTVFRNGKTSLIKDGDLTEHTSLHANMFALAFGLVRSGDREKVVQFIKTRKMACSVYGAQFLLDALYDSGEGSYALELLTSTSQRSWYNMIRSGSTITMEAWDKVYKPNLDLNHAWGAVPANTIVRKLAGIEPLTPGFESFQVKPQPGSLRFFNLKTPTLKGTIAVKFEKSTDSDILEVEVPGGSVARIYMPVSDTKPNFSMDGKKVSLTSQKGFYVLENVGSGKHILTLR